ncbi:MAG: MFS transporter [Syntrophobacteraceae bacterium]
MIHVYSLPHTMSGLVVDVYAIAMGVGLAILPSLAWRLGKKRVTIVLCVITLIVWIVYMVVSSLAVPSLLLFAVVFGFFFQAPRATGPALMESLPGVNPGNVGVAAGIWTMAANMGVFFLPILLGAVYDHFKIPGGMWSILIGYFPALVAVLAVKENMRFRCIAQKLMHYSG